MLGATRPKTTNRQPAVFRSLELPRRRHSHFQQEQAEHALEQRDEEAVVGTVTSGPCKPLMKPMMIPPKRRYRPGVQKHLVEQLATEDARLASSGPLRPLSPGAPSSREPSPVPTRPQPRAWSRHDARVRRRALSRGTAAGSYPGSSGMFPSASMPWFRSRATRNRPQGIRESPSRPASPACTHRRRCAPWPARPARSRTFRRNPSRNSRRPSPGRSAASGLRPGESCRQ